MANRLTSLIAFRVGSWGICIGHLRKANHHTQQAYNEIDRLLRRKAYSSTFLTSAFLKTAITVLCWKRNAHCVPHFSANSEGQNENIYVGNVDLATTEDELRNAFASYGAVQKVSVVTDRETGRPRGFAFVEMESDKEAQEALLGLTDNLGGSTLTVNEARPKTARVRS